MVVENLDDLSPSSMFLHKAMRYYRLWIYSCNLVLLVSVMVFVALAAWALSDFHMALFPSVRFHQPTFVYAYLALVLQGGILQAIGCVGALKMNEKMLNSYWSLMLALLVGDVIVGIVWIFRYQNLTSGLGAELKSRLQGHYGLDPHFQLLWDRIQSESRCCGVYGPSDYVNSSWAAAQERQFGPDHQAVPRACCKMEWAPLTQEYAPVNLTCVKSGADKGLVHQGGCLEPVHRWLQRNADILAVIGFCVIAFLKICFLAILRYEIREMIQKIKILKGLDDQSMINAGIPGFDQQQYIPKPCPATASSPPAATASAHPATAAPLGGGGCGGGGGPAISDYSLGGGVGAPQRNHPPGEEGPKATSNHVYNNNLPEESLLLRKDPSGGLQLSKSPNGNNNEAPPPPPSSREISTDHDYGSTSPV